MCPQIVLVIPVIQTASAITRLGNTVVRCGIRFTKMGVGTGGVVDMCTGEVVRGQLSTAGKQGQRRRGTLERQVGSTLAAEALAISATCAASRTPA